MALVRNISTILLLWIPVFAGCRQAPQPTASAQEPARAKAAAPTLRQRESSPTIAPPLPQPDVQPHIQPSTQSAPSSTSVPQLEDFEVRQGPFTFEGQTFTVVMHRKRVPGKKGEFAEALASLDIVDAAGTIAHHEEFPYTVEDGEIPENCSARVNPITGSNGAGLLLDVGCLPSAPLSGGPWQIFGVVNGKLAPIGKPIQVEGELGDFVPGKINHIGNLTQILADELRIRLFTGYFFVTVPVRVNWLEGKLALAEHCFYQTGHGMAEGGCEMPVEGVELHRTELDMSFVRMFTESNEQIGTPAHVVIQKNSRVEILGSKVFVRWEEEKENIGLGVGDDIWVKVRIDGKEGWIHTDEDLQAVGLYQAG